MTAQTAHIIYLEEYRARRESQAKERLTERGSQAVWWYPVLMWMLVPIPALYWRSPVME